MWLVTTSAGGAAADTRPPPPLQERQPANQGWQPANRGWACPTCTLLNAAASTRCVMECYTLATPFATPLAARLATPLATPLRCDMECGGLRPEGVTRLEGDTQRLETTPDAQPQWPRLPPRAASHLLPLLRGAVLQSAERADLLVPQPAALAAWNARHRVRAALRTHSKGAPQPPRANCQHAVQPPARTKATKRCAF